MKLGPLNIVREYRSSGLANPSQDLIDAIAGPPLSWAGERVTPGRMMQEAAIYSAIRQIAEAVGRSPFGVYRRLEDDTREEARGHRTWGLLHDAPNPETTAHSFWAAVAVQLLTWENAYIRKEAPDPFSPIDTLWLEDAGSVRVQWNGRAKTYRIGSGPGERKYTSEQILHIPGFSEDGLLGRSRAELCRQTLATTFARAKFEAEFYARGAKLGGVIEHPGRLGDAGTGRLKGQFEKWHAGQHHTFPVLEEGARLNPFGMSMQDMQFVELRQLSLAEIAVMFQLPPAYLGASTGDSLTYATTESNQVQFVTGAVDPITNRIGQAVSQDAELLPQNVMYARFNTDVLYVPDAKSRAERWQILKAINVVDAEFIAARENLPAPPPPEPPPPPPDPAGLNGNGAPPDPFAAARNGAT